MAKIGIDQLWVRLLGGAAFVVTLALMYAQGIALPVILGTVTLLLLLFLVLIMAFNVSPSLSSIETILADIRKDLSERAGQQPPGAANGGSPDRNRSSDPKTTGGGAFAGMALGGLIGLL